ncbi:MAG TPA: LysM peptidoglycan-binding domain-containing protein [Phototrophicaceae bacterium]|nr:LysM peptidoglycan-binding domain-containing protein [Phototrophicaceae bacterium]
MTQGLKKTHRRSAIILAMALVLMLVASFAAVAPTSADACTWTHKIEPGDTLGLLASFYNTTVTNLLALNPSITDANLIFWGTNICLSTTTPPPTPFPGSYTVQYGDTLGYLAFKFGATIADLAKANEISNINLIFAGATINVPTTPEAAAAG